MKKGRAPIGHDGSPVDLYHMTQTEANGFNGTRGALAEVNKSFHSDNFDTIHIYGRNHPDYISWRKLNPQAARQ